MRTIRTKNKTNALLMGTILGLSFSIGAYWLFAKHRQELEFTHVQSKHKISMLRGEYQKSKIELKSLYLKRQILVENTLKKKKTPVGAIADSNLKVSLAQVNNFTLASLEELERFDFVQNMLSQEIQGLMADTEVGTAFVVNLIPLENQIFKVRQEFFKTAASLNSIISKEKISSESKVPVFLAESLLTAEETKKNESK